MTEEACPADGGQFVISEMSVKPSKPHLKPAAYVGVCVTTIFLLLPKIGDFVVIAFVLGAFAAVFFATHKRKETLNLNDGAELGFLSGFYGLLTAGTIYGVIWKFFHCELWQMKNADRLLSLLVDSVRDMFNPVAWLVISIQMIAFSVLAGIIGVPAGLLAVKIFQHRAGR